MAYTQANLVETVKLAFESQQWLQPWLTDAKLGNLGRLEEPRQPVSRLQPDAAKAVGLRKLQLEKKRGKVNYKE